MSNPPTTDCFGISFCVAPQESETESKPKLYQTISPRSQGYRQITRLLPQYNKEPKLFVYVIKISQILKLPSVHPMFEGSNPFVEMKLETKDSSVRDQIQRTSYKPLTISPEWLPPERFLFYSYQADSTILSQLHFTVYSLPGFSESSTLVKMLGTMSLALNAISNHEKEYTLPLYDADGSLNGAQLKLTAQRMSLEKSNAYKEVCVYEYERWQPLFDWGNYYPGYLLPTDPGRWSDISGTIFANDLTEIVEAVPEGWTGGAFEVISTNKDPRGWEYAVDYDYSDWYPVIGTQTYVRRRIWKTEILHPQIFSDPSNNSSLPSDSTSGLPPPPPSPSQQLATNSPSRASSSSSSSSSIPTPPHGPTTTTAPVKAEFPPPQSCLYFFITYLSNSTTTTTPPTTPSQIPLLGIMIPLVLLPNSSQFVQIVSALELIVSQSRGGQINTKGMYQFFSAKDTATTKSTAPFDQNLALDLYTAGTVLLKLESALRDHDQQSFIQIIQILIPPSPEVVVSTPFLEISHVAVNNLKDVELFGSMDPYVELDCYTDHTTPWWTYQTPVSEGAGKESEWKIDQHISLQPSQYENPQNTFRVRVKDKNTVKKDVLIGKGTVLFSELTSVEWTTCTIPMKNKKGKLHGNVVITYRFQPLSSPSATSSESSQLTSSASSTSSLSHLLQNPPHLIPIFLFPIERLVYDPAIISRKERVDKICLKYGMKYCEYDSSSSTNNSNKKGDSSVESVVLMLGLDQHHTASTLENKNFPVMLECLQELQNLKPIPMTSSSSPVSALV